MVQGTAVLQVLLLQPRVQVFFSVIVQLSNWKALILALMHFQPLIQAVGAVAVSGFSTVMLSCAETVPAGRELFSGMVSVEEEQAVRSRPKRTMPKSASFFMIV